MMVGVNRPAKIIYVIGQLTIGGTEMQLLALVQHLNPARYNVLVVCLSGQAPLAESFVKTGCKVCILHREQRGRLRVLMALYHLVRDFQPDIVHSFGYASRAAIPAAKLSSKAVNLVSIRTQPGGLLGVSDYLLNSFADGVLTNSQKAAQAIRFGFIQKVPCQVVYNGIDLQAFDEKARDAVVLPADSTNQKVICIVARLHPVKRIEILLDAFALVCKALGSVRLWVVGDGAERENLQRQTAQLGLSSRVVYWGEQDNIPAILRHAHVGVLSSRIEGLSNAILEYMASSLPVVATNTGGNGEIVLHGKTGFLVPVDDVNALANALMMVLGDEHLAHQLGQAGRAHVEHFFSMARMVRETEAIYEQCFSRESNAHFDDYK